jgi:hypothetical protein
MLSNICQRQLGQPRRLTSIKSLIFKDQISLSGCLSKTAFIYSKITSVTQKPYSCGKITSTFYLPKSKILILQKPLSISGNLYYPVCEQRQSAD